MYYPSVMYIKKSFKNYQKYLIVLYVLLYYTVYMISVHSYGLNIIDVHVSY